MCLVLPIRRPRTVVNAPSSLAEPYSSVLAFRYDGALPTVRTRRAGPGSASACWLVLAGPGGRARRRRGRRASGPATRRSGATCCWPARSRSASAALYVLYVQVRCAPAPSFDWPIEMDRVHPFGWLAVLLLVADVIVDRVWQARRTDTMTEPTDSGFILGVDLDGVCGDYTGALRDVVAERTGVDPDSLPLERSWDFREWGLSPAEFERHPPGGGAGAPHLPHHAGDAEGVAEALWRLSDAGVWIRIITHRLYVNWGHATAVADTVDWLDATASPTGTCASSAPSPRSRPTATSRTPRTTSSPCARRVPT